MKEEFVFETIGDFLLRRLREVGISHLFGVAGDFNLEFLEQLERTPGMRWVGCCNELNAAYAADGFARTHGLAALVTTYGVGELSALCGVAGAYAEHLPIIFVTGAPPLADIERNSLMHHTAGDGNFDNMMICARQFSAAQARITPQTAASDIDRCIRACVLQKRPVYLQLPADLALVRIMTPAVPIAIAYQSDSQMLEDFTAAAAVRIAESKTIAILVDADVARFSQDQKVTELAAKLQCPIAVMGTAKGAIDETDPSYMGVYAGAVSPSRVRAVIEEADCLVQLGVRFFDSTTASFSQRIDPSRVVEINAWSGRVNGDTFQGICMADMLSGLLANLRQATGQKVCWQQPVEPKLESPKQLSQVAFWNRIQRFLREGDVVVAENGTSLSGVTGLRFPGKCSLICQALWGAIGYTLPATFGSLIAAPERRHILFIGDGSFQLTAQELSSILRHDLKPIIFLLNNDGYTIERLILGEKSSYNDIQPWKYASLCDVLSNKDSHVAYRVTSMEELEAVLEGAFEPNRCRFVEVKFDRMDAPESLRRLGPLYARQDYGRSWVDSTQPSDLNSPGIENVSNGRSL
jgi:indolepyruvate decarboxylase